MRGVKRSIGVLILAAAFMGLGGLNAHADHRSCVLKCRNDYAKTIKKLTKEYGAAYATCAAGCFLDVPACLICEGGALAWYDIEMDDAATTAQDCVTGCPPDPTPPPAE